MKSVVCEMCVAWLPVVVIDLPNIHVHVYCVCVHVHTRDGLIVFSVQLREMVAQSTQSTKIEYA